MRFALSKSRVVLLDKVPTERSCKRLFCFEHLSWIRASYTKDRGWRTDTTQILIFYINRQGALADGLHGLNPRNTGLRYTPQITLLAC
jgi:hypothetical protein